MAGTTMCPGHSFLRDDDCALYRCVVCGMVVLDELIEDERWDDIPQELLCTLHDSGTRIPVHYLGFAPYCKPYDISTDGTALLFCRERGINPWTFQEKAQKGQEDNDG